MVKLQHSESVLSLLIVMCAQIILISVYSNKSDLIYAQPNICELVNQITFQSGKRQLMEPLWILWYEQENAFEQYLKMTYTINITKYFVPCVRERIGTKTSGNRFNSL
ncbi:Hypothetical_protein [Hexamita inflata]|uniref:Hypothetical_protein n=1 Tax=Hexamita inflata TaxID=28002 RepID=A0AA86NXQ3_9EUKA|nr:Hypothetical protein HINF_LOCUS14932 [Hexamita inflata]CAI9927288.1 Hypothetical protein HINF_LOCUS14933 [Hexamita inflata]